MIAHWTDVLAAIQTKVPATTFNRWFRPLTPQKFTTSELCLLADDEFDAVFIERNFAQLIRLHISRIVGEDIELKIVHEPLAKTECPGITVPDSIPKLRQNGRSILTDPPLTIQPAEPTPTERILASGLKLQYTFDSFVVGDSNEFAHAACRTVFNHPGCIYNPLFLYGAVGLGKTHLLNAVGIELLRADPKLNVHYTTTENFMNRLIEHLKAGEMKAFRAYYRDEVDVLLVDDIQFLAGKESTKQEFFHTFNTLHQAGKQIVITSDRTPQDLRDIESRLRSRFQWGLIADIQAPALETRLAIIERKAQALNLELTSDVALFLAEHIRDNVREIEGALLRLHAYSDFNNKRLTKELAKSLLQQLLKGDNRRVSVEHIQKVVSSYFQIRVADMKGKERKRAFSKPRQLAMYLAKRLTGLSYPQLGEKFGGRDHTTVLAACRKVTDLVDSDQTVGSAVAHLEKEILRS